MNKLGKSVSEKIDDILRTVNSEAFDLVAHNLKYVIDDYIWASIWDKTAVIVGHPVEDQIREQVSWK